MSDANLIGELKWYSSEDALDPQNPPVPAKQSHSDAGDEISEHDLDETPSSSKHLDMPPVDINKKEEQRTRKRRKEQGTESDPFVIGEHGDPQAVKMRIVHISDTHMKHDNYLLDIPHGDILVHSGDFASHQESKKGTEREAFEKDIRTINSFFSKLPHTHKIFVAGNHETSFNSYRLFNTQIQLQLKNIIYLQDSGIRINGVYFYGSPWTRSVNMGFSTKDTKKYWDKIPDDTDVLITHMPPLNILDLAYSKKAATKMQNLTEEERIKLPHTCKICREPRHGDRAHWGCSDLRKAVLHRIK